jgi:hypothetical protein
MILNELSSSGFQDNFEDFACILGLVFLGVLFKVSEIALKGASGWPYLL